MKKRNLIVAGTLATGLVVAAAGAVNAHQRGGFGPGFDGPPGATCQGAGFGGPSHGGPGFDLPGLGGMGPLHGLMRVLDLSDSQRDKIFDIMYAQVPAARDKMNELRKGHNALHAATTAQNYDAAKVRELADAQAKMMAELIVMRTETFNKAYGLLTPEQQKRVAELKESGWRRPHGW